MTQLVRNFEVFVGKTASKTDPKRVISSRWVPQKYCEREPTAAETEARDSGFLLLERPLECVEDI